jgi:primosomal protein N' (replication factor Y)
VGDIGAADGPARLVSVAVDAVGPAGARTWTYEVPARLGDLAAGEAVIVPFGRRNALAIVLGESGPPPAGAVRSIADRVRTDGPLLPPLTLAVARWMAGHYLAPPAITVRAFLPPGLLERLQLTVEATPAAVGATVTEEDARLLGQIGDRRRAVRSIRSGEGRGALLRRLRMLEGRGLVHLDWTLEAAGAAPRYVRWVVATREGRQADQPGGAPGSRRLRPRSTAALAQLGEAGDVGLEATVLVARHGASAVATLVRRGLARVETREAPRRPLAGLPRPGGTRPAGADLTSDQRTAAAAIGTAIRSGDSRPFLLTGVTGAGKTTVYREVIAESLALGRPAVVLVPEVAHARPIADRLRAELAASIALVHSGLSEGERADEWRRIRAGAADVVIGTRLAISAPIRDVGVVIVDEEHDAAYKSDRSPRLQARDVAIRLAELTGAACVLGSATPSVEAEGRARDGSYRRLTLSEPATGAPSAIEIVDLRRELAAGNRGLLSRRLVEALGALDILAGDQAILVINRRGAASVVLCRDCGTSQACDECGRPLVFHLAGMSLRCHECGAAAPLATRCPACGSPRIRYLGGGTQRVEREVREAFPGLRVGRLDRDVAERRGAADRVVEAFADGRLDVLVGTSLVAKALDVPNVILAGVVSADIALNLPDARAAERTYQLLVQAVGRAGRGDRPGVAIIQTYQPHHPVIEAVATRDPAAFYDAELVQRRAFGAPPYGRLVKLVVALPDRDAAVAAAATYAAELRSRASERGDGSTVSGPVTAFVPRRAGRWRFLVIVRGPDPVTLLDGGPPPPWTVDVDPDSLL